MPIPHITHRVTTRGAEILVFGYCNISVRENDWRCHARVSPARSPGLTSSALPGSGSARPFRVDTHSDLEISKCFGTPTTTETVRLCPHCAKQAAQAVHIWRWRKRGTQATWARESDHAGVTHARQRQAFERTHTLLLQKPASGL